MTKIVISVLVLSSRCQGIGRCLTNFNQTKAMKQIESKQEKWQKKTQSERNKK